MIRPSSGRLIVSCETDPAVCVSTSLSMKSHSVRFCNTNSFWSVRDFLGKQKAQNLQKIQTLLRQHGSCVRRTNTDVMSAQRVGRGGRSDITGKQGVKHKRGRGGDKREGRRPITVNHLLSYCGSGEEKLQGGRQSSARSDRSTTELSHGKHH